MSEEKKKLDTKGISFGTWLVFFSFAIIILVSLWVLQLASLKPYYRSMKVNAVQKIATDITEILEDKENFASSISNITYNNDICLSIYNHDKEKLAFVNGMGLGCYIGVDSNFNDASMLERIDQSLEVNDYVTDERFSDDNLIYGRKIKSNLDTYYLIVNAVVEPVDSTVFIIRNQFIIIAFVVLGLSVLLSWIFSQKYSRPIKEITYSANLMADGDYSVKFHEKSFTEINELASTLNYATDELSKAEELQRELLANVSHDIKTPLTTIKAYAEMIDDISGDNKEKRHEHLGIIISETNHLNKLVNDMMTLSKVESGQYVLDITAFDLVDVTNEIVNVLKGYASEVNIIKNIPLHAVIYGDKTLVGQVIYNFLNNAIKHVGNDKQIIINITPNDINWQFEVIDHGLGISSEEMPYIWDRYYKANKKYRREQESSGLGLAISKAYLDAHKYKFGCESEVNKGSKFYFIASGEPIGEE